MLKRKKSNNKGFTLVELIVVIVILAILIGVSIGGLYSWVGKSRNNTDINNAASIQSALSSLAADKDVYTWANAGSKNSQATITWSAAVANASIALDESSTDLTSTEKFADKIKKILTDGLPAPKVATNFVLTIDANGGNPKITCVATGATPQS